MTTPIAALTITQLNEYIKGVIDTNPLLSDVHVKGEISNFTNHAKTGHFYFTLKDEGGALSAVMFRGQAAKLPFVPENGMKVTARGRISAYVKGGTYQLYAEDIVPDGVGSLHIAFEQLKAKLAAEGLFDESKKRPLPKIPSCVAIITSPTGAAVRDMINVLSRRFPYAKVLVYPSLVQGENAPAQLIEGLAYLNENAVADVIIMGRGGGSIEDLWAFNHEGLARAVAGSKIPVISAVGHETDFTICDFVADLRAPTPSAAAELAVPNTADLVRRVNNITTHMQHQLQRRISQGREGLVRLSSARTLTDPSNYIDDRRMAVLALATRAEGLMESKISALRGTTGAMTASLRALDPLAVVARGYTAVFNEDGKLVKTVEQVSVGDKFYFEVSDGKIQGEVTEKWQKSN